jgi:prepilin peptidase CpaA
LVLPAVLGPPWAWLLGGWTAAWAPLLGTWIGFITLALVVTCAYTDLSWRKIFNWATYPALLWAFGLNLAGTLFHLPEIADPDGPGFVGHVGLVGCLGGFAVCFFLMMLVYRLAKGGAGDVKLAAVLGALLGVERGLYALALTYIVAGVVLTLWLIWTVGPLAIVVGLLRKVGSFLLPAYIAGPDPERFRMLASPVPLGLFFAIGTVATLLGVERLWLP